MVYMPGGKVLLLTILEIVILLMIIGMIITRKESVPKKCMENKIILPFYRLGGFIYRKTFGKEGNFYYQKIFDKNSLIYAAKENREITSNYFIEKLGLCLLSLFVGLVFVVILSLKNMDESIIKEGNLIERGSYTDRAQKIVLDAGVDEEELKDIEIEVSERKYSEEEFYEILNNFYIDLEKEFLADNQSLDMVNSKINLIDELEGYPFILEWKIENKDYIDREGNITDAVSENGVLVKIKVTISYYEYSGEHEFYVKVFPKELSRNEMLIKRIQEMINNSQLETESNQYMVLPESIDGVKIIWKEKKTKNVLVFTALVIAVVVGVFIGKDMDLDKKIQERNSQMMDDYAEIISKLTLLVGAGMSVVSAWKKIAKDYQRKKAEGMMVHFAYEEMTYTMYEMDSGITENRCYQHFADRVKIQKYVKLVSLLEQNIKMGTSGLIEDLKRESSEAFTERKNLAEKKGEEAATKLLLPMFLMLLIVMVVIMVPAFMSM